MDSDLALFRALKTRFDNLAKELRHIREEWGKVRNAPPDTYNELLKIELLARETGVFEELQELLDSAVELVDASLER